MMPFMFVSGAFAPLRRCRGGCSTMAAFNPVAHAIDALRGTVLGTAGVTDIGVAIASALALWAAVALIPDGSRRRPTPDGA